MSVDDARIGLDEASIRQGVEDHLRFSRGRTVAKATPLDICHALSLATRDRLMQRWLATEAAVVAAGAKRAYYLSAEFLLGRQLQANLLALGITDIARSVVAALGHDLDDVVETEEDPGLGNGGLGRLAACYMESAATLQLPVVGYGIRYEFGIFRQTIEDGWQVENPDEWLKRGNPWEVAQPTRSVTVGFGGTVSHHERQGKLLVRWTPDVAVIGTPYDTPVAGFDQNNNTVNTLRLWSARASEEFDLAVFNDGDYRRAVEQKAVSESISKVLYPKDSSPEGKRLRLKQQYFFVACSLHDLLARFDEEGHSIQQLPEHVAIQLNDTHPAVTIAELMRVLVDERGMDWGTAWDLTRRTVAYTNHTLLPEALERWPLGLFGELLPRHLQIIAEIDRRFQLEAVEVLGPDAEAVRIIRDDAVHMANLSVVGAHTVNGVAALHSRLLTERTMPEFAAMLPDRFTNVTNGVTPRRWLAQSNPALHDLIGSRLEPGFLQRMGDLRGLDAAREDTDLHRDLMSIKAANKAALAAYLQETQGLDVDPNALFDVQVKRIHEYKRQLMCALHVVHLYRKIKLEGVERIPRVVFIGGKAAPGYARAKHHIKLINDVAKVIREDPDVAGRLQLVFLENYNVSFAERVIPAADLSEQISLAGKEASGTGNMKFQLNGALTIGTLDGANIEIRDNVGAENFFLFGMDAAEVQTVRRAGYVPSVAVANCPELEAALDLIASGYFNAEEPALHREVVRYLTAEDPYLVCQDFPSYIRAQEAVEVAYADQSRWMPKVVSNIAGAGHFSSDRSIREYAERIWDIRAVDVEAV